VTSTTGVRAVDDGILLSTYYGHASLHYSEPLQQ
jgi:hypothetical protein